MVPGATAVGEAFGQLCVWPAFPLQLALRLMSGSVPDESDLFINSIIEETEKARRAWVRAERMNAANLEEVTDRLVEAEKTQHDVLVTHGIDRERIRLVRERINQRVTGGS